MQPWYKVVSLRKEVREGRSFDPREFAIHLEQVVSGQAPEDYRNPEKFFARTSFTRTLTEHCGMVLRRLGGETSNTAAVLTLVTQFGGGKTHTLTALYHLLRAGKKARDLPGVAKLLDHAKLTTVPSSQVAIFVGNAWDPQEGRETPWIDLARQVAGSEGVEILGKAARSTPPGTEALGRLFEAAGGSALILCDEVLNFANRHRALIEPFHAFLQNLTVALTGTAGCAAVISLPRSQVEMTDWDQRWQERITKVVRRVAKDLIANDEAEIAEVVRRRLFEDLGGDRLRANVAKAFADWSFERRHQLPPEWTAVDTATSEKKAREQLQWRFESCYPFHPATLSVFQRKWQSLQQYQQTRGTLAMLAQWISCASVELFKAARNEPLITLGSAPLEVGDFRSVVLGQIGESRLGTAMQTDISGSQSHARLLDADSRGPLKDIHRRVGAAIFFESSGGQTEKVAHLPELRFAIGEPEVDTTSIDNAAMALESRGFYVRRAGSDGFLIHHQPTLKKVVSDRRASLDADTEVKPAMESLVKEEFDRGRTIPCLPLPGDGNEVADSPRLTLVVMHPEHEWGTDGALRGRVAEWTRKRGKSDRHYPAALVWCFKKPGRELREAVETWLAWQRVRREIEQETLGGEFDAAEKAELQSKARAAQDDARDEVWASYRYVVLADRGGDDGLQVIDLGAGHSSASESLCGRVIAALKSNALLNETIGAGYIERNWPPALKESGAWPLSSLRKAFLDGSLTRLVDPDTVLRQRVVEFVQGGDFGLASGPAAGGGYDRLWFAEPVDVAEVAFEPGVLLLTKERASQLKVSPTPEGEPESVPPPTSEPDLPAGPEPAPPQAGEPVALRVHGSIPSEVWNRLGTKLLPKLKSGKDLVVRIDLSATFGPQASASLRGDLQRVLEDLGIADRVRVD